MKRSYTKEEASIHRHHSRNTADHYIMLHFRPFQMKKGSSTVNRYTNGSSEQQNNKLILQCRNETTPDHHCS